MVDKLTGDIADTSDRAHALEKGVSDGTKTTICQSGRKRSFHHDGAFPGFSDFPADGPQVGGMKGLEEHSWALKSVSCRTTDEVERLICTEKRLRSTWGPKKIRQILTTKDGLESPPP